MACLPALLLGTLLAQAPPAAAPAPAAPGTASPGEVKPGGDAATLKPGPGEDAMPASAKPLYLDMAVVKAGPPASGAAVAAKSNLPPDYRDYVYLASDRPVLLRFHLQHDGQPYYAAWDRYMNKLFDHFDRNGDGVLSKEETERVPNVNYLRNHLAGAIGAGDPQNQTVKMAEMDTDKNGTVSRAEFADYFRRSGFTPLNFNLGSNQPNTDAINDALFKYLEGEDGKLTKERAAKAPLTLARLDTDEDEMITAEELTPNRGNNRGFGGVVFFPDGGMGPRQRQPGDLIEVQPGAPRDGVVQQILTRYDKDKDGKLSREEIGLDAKTFDELDANHDGKLDAAELARFLAREPDVELLFRSGKPVRNESAAGTLLRDIGKELGIPGAEPSRVALHNPTDRPMPLAAGFKTIPGGATLTLGDATLELSATDAQFGQFRGSRQFYMQQYESLDVDKKGFIERAQAMQNQFLKEIFGFADRDGDGKLTLKEFNAFFDLQEEGSGCTMAVAATDQGRSLFDLIDADRDGRLSVRELRTAWARLAPFSKDGNLTRPDIPKRMTLNFGPSQGGRFGRAVFVGGGRPGMAPNRQRGPAWFYKMDRNGDGDISPREFLGTEEEFRAIDTDGDGLISLEEAIAFDARCRKAAKEARENKDNKP
jgi:Ca2+-binding EF-hand superfamily protein